MGLDSRAEQWIQERIRIHGCSSLVINGLPTEFHARDALGVTREHDTAMIAEFTAKAEGADLAIAVVERRPLMARFPQTKRTWLSFRGGSYSGANLFAFGSSRVLPAIEQWRAVEQERWRATVGFIDLRYPPNRSRDAGSIDTILLVADRCVSERAKGVSL